MSARPSLAIVCPFSWTVPGGVQTHVAGLARHMRRQGWDVDVLAPADHHVEDPGFRSLGRTIAFRDNGSITRVALGPAAAARTIRIIRERGYDLVHLHEPMTPATCLTALVTARVPIVGTFHTAAPSRRWYRLFGPLLRQAAPRLHARIAVSEPAHRFVSSAFPGGYSIIPNAIETATYAPNGYVRGDRLVFLGRPDPRKGLNVLLDALALLDPVPDVDLIGVRPRDLGRRVWRRPRRVTRSLHAHGRVTAAERRRLLGEGAVLCAPSLGRESFGLVLLEGMAAGIPVVASHIPAYERVLPPDCGSLVPPGDPRALADALSRLFADSSLRRRPASPSRREAAGYDWSVVGEQVTDVYREVLGRNGNGGPPAPARRGRTGPRR